MTSRVVENHYFTPISQYVLQNHPGYYPLPWLNRLGIIYAACQKESLQRNQTRFFRHRLFYGLLDWHLLLDDPLKRPCHHWNPTLWGFPFIKVFLCPFRLKPEIQAQLDEATQKIPDYFRPALCQWTKTCWPSGWRLYPCRYLYPLLARAKKGRSFRLRKR